MHPQVLNREIDVSRTTATAAATTTTTAASHLSTCDNAEADVGKEILGPRSALGEERGGGTDGWTAGISRSGGGQVKPNH
jgi:hypothetical protein